MGSYSSKNGGCRTGGRQVCKTCREGLLLDTAKFFAQKYLEVVVATFFLPAENFWSDFE